MRDLAKKSALAFAAAALAVSSTVSGAAGTSAAPSPAIGQVAQSPWLQLSMLTSTGSAGLADSPMQPGGADNGPPPPAYGTGRTPPVPVIAIWLGTLAMAVYILTIHERGHGQFPTPPANSPA